MVLKALYDFLRSAFSKSEWRRLTRFNLHPDVLGDSVNWDGPMNEVVENFIFDADKNGLIGQDLFSILKSARPGEVDRIQTCIKGPDELSEQGQPHVPAKPLHSEDNQQPPFSREEMYEALKSLSDQYFEELVGIYVDQDARLLVGNRTGQRAMVLELINHYDVPYRGLTLLIEAIRKINKGLIRN